METKYLYVLETNNKNEIIEMIINEDNYQLLEEGNYFIEIMRMRDTGSLSVFLSTKNESFTKEEMHVVTQYLKGIGRELEYIGVQKVGLSFDKIQDIRPYKSKDLHFPYQKSYKTIKYARMIGYALMLGLKEYYESAPDSRRLGLIHKEEEIFNG